VNTGSNFNKPQVATKLPVVLTRTEIQQLLAAIDPKYKLIAQLLYDSGLRLMEGVWLPNALARQYPLAPLRHAGQFNWL
jgi:site-specific recombinase XerD